MPKFPPKDLTEEIKVEDGSSEVVFLVREDGIIKIANKDAIREKEWQYIMTDATGRFTLIDEDATKAKPLVKTILNDLDLFPEMRMLKIVQLMIGVLIALTIGFFIVDIYRYPSLETIKTITDDAVKSILEQKKKDSNPAEKIKSIISGSAIPGTEK